MTRQHLPNRRRAVTFDVKPGGATYSVGIGLYDDNRLGEVFLSGSKTGSDMASLINDAAVLVSITLQYGTPVSVLSRAMVSVRSGRGMGAVKRISHVEARPHKVLSFCW